MKVLILIIFTMFSLCKHEEEKDLIRDKKEYKNITGKEYK